MEASGALNCTAVSLMKIGNDIRLLGELCDACRLSGRVEMLLLCQIPLKEGQCCVLLTCAISCCRLWAALRAGRAAAACQRARQQHHAWQGEDSSPKQCTAWLCCLLCAHCVQFHALRYCRSTQRSARRSQWWQPRQVHLCGGFCSVSSQHTCFKSVFLLLLAIIEHQSAVSRLLTGDGQQRGHWRSGRLGAVRAQRVQAHADRLPTAVHKVQRPLTCTASCKTASGAKL